MKIKTNIFYILFSLTHHTVVLTKDGAIPAPALGEQTIREQIKIEKKNQLHLLYVCNLLAKQKKKKKKLYPFNVVYKRRHPDDSPPKPHCKCHTKNNKKRTLI